MLFVTEKAKERIKNLAKEYQEYHTLYRLLDSDYYNSTLKENKDLIRMYDIDGIELTINYIDISNNSSFDFSILSAINILKEEEKDEPNYWESKSRYDVSPKKLINMLLVAAFLKYEMFSIYEEDEDIIMLNIFKYENIENMLNEGEEFLIVEGEDIVKFYDHRNYHSSNYYTMDSLEIDETSLLYYQQTSEVSPEVFYADEDKGIYRVEATSELSKSCMGNNQQSLELLELYIRNKDKVKLAVVLLDGKVVGRCLLWQEVTFRSNVKDYNLQVVKGYDRIYYGYTRHLLYLKHKLESMNYIDLYFKDDRDSTKQFFSLKRQERKLEWANHIDKLNNRETKKEIEKLNDLLLFHINPITQLIDTKNYPYLDTFRYGKKVGDTIQLYEVPETNEEYLVLDTYDRIPETAIHGYRSTNSKSTNVYCKFNYLCYSYTVDSKEDLVKVVSYVNLYTKKVSYTKVQLKFLRYLESKGIIKTRYDGKHDSYEVINNVDLRELEELMKLIESEKEEELQLN